MLATARALPASGEGWSAEFKWDGYRAQALCSTAGQTRLTSRNGRSLADSFPEVITALRELHVDARLSLDGEVVALGESGAPDFERLQRRLGTSPAPALQAAVPVTYVVFDVLDIDGPTVDLTYERRRELLAELDLAHPHLVVPGYQSGIAPETLLHIAENHELEGLVLKKLSSKYVSGRSQLWTKHPLRRSIEVVIGGYAPSRAGAGELGSLLMGRPTGPGPGRTRPGLDFVGAVGTGWSSAAGRRLIDQLSSSARPTAPFSRPVPAQYTRAARWVAPELVADVKYRSWTIAGLLRHASFRGLRPDRSPAKLTLDAQ